MTAVIHPLTRRPAPPFASWSPRLVEPPAPRRLPPPTGTVGTSVGPSVGPSRATFRRRRAVAALTAAVLLGGGAALVVPGEVSLASSGAPAAPLVPVGLTTYVVQPGDTLWHIARALQPSGDVRPLVQRLGAARAGAPLQVGERLALPAGATGVTGPATRPP